MTTSMNIRQRGSFPEFICKSGISPMSKTIKAAFTTRRDAEMAVEHLVQEHRVDRNAVRIEAVSDPNTAGTQVAGGDVERGHEKTQTEGSPALAGKIRVSADVDDAASDKVLSSFKTYGGSEITV